jgi:hypothetical protein
MIWTQPLLPCIVMGDEHDRGPGSPVRRPAGPA